MGEHDMDTDDDPDAFFGAFKKRLTETDEIANVILKGHLIAESALNDIICVIFFHPEHIPETWLLFERTVQIVRAMSLRTNNYPGWDGVLALNSLRNEIAHKHAGLGRQKKMDRLRQACLANLMPEKAKLHEGDSDCEMAVLACAGCAGFLAHVEDDFRALRSHIDELDAKINPNKERVPIKPRP
jgi:hypothetical protein